MKKTTLLQSDLSYIIATLGHVDMLVIADAGLPIPVETVRTDLAPTQVVPGAAQTLRMVLDEMKVEKVILAEEVKNRNPKFLLEVRELLPDVPVEFLTHSELKTRAAQARAVVRIGEFSPCANVILVSELFFKIDGQDYLNSRPTISKTIDVNPGKIAPITKP
jgi:D-ribose pyranase